MAEKDKEVVGMCGNVRHRAPQLLFKLGVPTGQGEVELSHLQLSPTLASASIAC